MKEILLTVAKKLQKINLRTFLMKEVHAFFHKEPSYRPSSESSLFSDLFLSNSSTKSSLIVP